MKASLSELFSALRGITRAGVPLVQTGADTKRDTIPRLAFESASLQYNVLCDIIRFPEKIEFNITKISGFLSRALPDLQSHGHLILASKDGRQGGTLSDVAIHIQDILAREILVGVARPDTKMRDQKLVDDFLAAYLPQGRAQVERPVYEEIDRPDLPRRAPHRKGGRPRKHTTPEPA